MAKRYCGEVCVELYWEDKHSHYRARVRCPDGKLTVFVDGKSITDIAVDSPIAYDIAAQAALAFAVGYSDHAYAYEKRDAAVAIADAAASGITDGHYLMNRRPNK